MEYSRQQLEQNISCLLKEGKSPAAADIFLVEIEGKKLVLKDFRRKNPIWRWTIGRIAIAREVRAYKLLQGLKGVARFYCQPDAYGLVIEYINGERLPHRKSQYHLPADFFQQLTSLVEQMHQRGVAHGDLRKKNVFFTSTGEPYILDFATATCVTPFSNWFKRIIFKRVCLIDNLAVKKLKAKLAPDSLTPAEKEDLSHLPFFLRLGRFVRKKIYRSLIKRIWRKKRTKDNRSKTLGTER
ncbi:MAG: hypothetical protein N2246_06240 [Candidatus Sumerlaeia bacterium]|nr:hypothetical protein [Candidatus Sumerlaeia bacterium]